MDFTPRFTPVLTDVNRGVILSAMFQQNYNRHEIWKV